MNLRLVVGLGNPGGEYRFTRHNAGFWVLDTYLSRQGKKANKRVADDTMGVRLSIGSEEIWFIKPLTFMNRSGRVVAPFVRELDCPAEEVLVIYDEADLEPGRLQLKKGGGSAGHNGIESIFAEWGERDFFRLRVGVGKVPDKALADYVLEEAPEAELKALGETGADALEKILSLGPAKAMGEINAVALASRS